MRTGVHDFLFYYARYLFVHFFVEFSRFSFGFFQSDRLFAIRTFCHLFLLISVMPGLTISNRLTPTLTLTRFAKRSGAKSSAARYYYFSLGVFFFYISNSIRNFA